MSLWIMVVREIAYRKLNFLLGLAGVVGAVGMLVAVLMSLSLHEARSERIVRRKEAETKTKMALLSLDVKRAMQHLGYNATILPEGQPLSDWYADDYAAKNMPESWPSRLDGTKNLVDRYRSRLRKKISWVEKKWTIIVVGLGEEHILDTSVCDRSPLVRGIPKQQCVVGHELSGALGIKPGDTITLRGRPFQVARCDKELGTKDDITIWMNLADAQRLLDAPDVINEILIVEHASVWGRLEQVRRQVAKILPGCQVVEMESETLARAHARTKVAEAARASVEQERAKQRLLRSERLSMALKLVPLGAVGCAVWIGLLMYFNVRERVEETGIYMTLGFRTCAVRALFLRKAMFVGAAGGVLGFLLGTIIALAMDAGHSEGITVSFGTMAGHCGFSLALGIFAGIVGSWLPVGAALRTDPAVVLRQQ